ncbi:uncharacterized protein [Montipora foliosa]|uniref:uncharacterized protein n=1 Tax=Montipora foliosa TaxID=591990 RepID=UPI0035F10C73
MDHETKQSPLAVVIAFTLVLLSGQWTNIGGCSVKELGVKLPGTNRIPDKYMTSSTQLNNNYPAFRGRIGIKRIGSFADAWCASESDSSPFIQVYFEMLTNFKVIESEGVDIDGNDLWVQSYVVSISNDSARGWMDYENGVAQELLSNTDIHATNVSLNDSWAYFIRIHPKRHFGKWACMRIALYGCQNGQQFHTKFNDIFNDAPLTKAPLNETLLLVLPIVVFFCVIIAGLICLCRRYRTTHSCILRARPPQELKEITPTAETRTGIKSIVIYEDPPPYESQTVSLHFGHDTYDERDLPPEMPAFIESNKIFSFDRGHIQPE